MNHEETTDQGDRYVSIVSLIAPVLAARNYRDAISILEAHRDEAASKGQLFLASLCSNLLAYVLTSSSRAGEALKAYQAAHQFFPSSSTARDVAKHLVDLGRPDEANLFLAEQLLDSTDPGEQQKRISFAGFSLLVGGNFDAAEEHLLRSLDMARSANLSAREWDLTLICEMVRRHVAIDTCRAYLEELGRRAAIEDNLQVRQLVTILLQSLTPLPPSRKA